MRHPEQSARHPRRALWLCVALLSACGVREAAVPLNVLPPEPPLAPETEFHLYVAANGADSNSGTEQAPFRSIARAAQAARPGTTVHVAPGSYPGGFQTAASGTAKARIYYVSTRRWGARIVPPLDANAPAAWDNRGNYIDIVGFEVDGTVFRGGTKWSNGIYSAGSHDVIRGNHVHHIATTADCSSAGGAGIGIGSYYRGVRSDVVGNIVHDIGPAGCRFIQGIAIETSGSVKNNVVYRVSEAAIHLWRDADRVIVANNTVSGSNTGIVVGGGDFYHTMGPDDHTRVSNNIVFDNQVGIAEQGATGRNNSYRNNLVSHNVDGDWRLGSGMTHTGTVDAPPEFLAYSRSGTPDFRLSSTSPAIGRGLADDAHPNDLRGAARNAVTGIDIGAYQH